MVPGEGLQKRFNRNSVPKVQAEESPALIDPLATAYPIVRDYIIEHPGSTVMEVSNGTGISPGLILDLVRDGRIRIIETKPFI